MTLGKRVNSHGVLVGGITKITIVVKGLPLPDWSSAPPVDQYWWT